MTTLEHGIDLVTQDLKIEVKKWIRFPSGVFVCRWPCFGRFR